MASILRPSVTQAAASIARQSITGRFPPSHRYYTPSASQASTSYHHRSGDVHESSAASSSSSPSTSSSPSSSPPGDNTIPPPSSAQSSLEHQIPATSVPPSPPVNKPLSQTKVATELDKQPLPWLSRPLGVQSKPLTLSALAALPKRTRAERAEDYLSGGRQKERVNIVKSATKGYFHDFHSLKAHGGKTWRAPATLIREDRALWFPHVSGTCLADRTTKDTVELTNGKVSIIAILNSRISEEHTRSFYAPAHELYSSHPAFQVLHLNLQPNLFKNIMISIFLSSLREQIPKPFHDGYLLTKLDLDALGAGEDKVHREDLGAANKHVGYTYLVDQNGKIRWAGGGFAERGEREALLACTGVLLGRTNGE